MTRITGIRSVDYHLTAVGEGVVNWHGVTPVRQPATGNVVRNHRLPNLAITDGTGARRSGGVPALDDPRFAEAALIVSAQCVRGALFRETSFGLREVTRENVDRVLASLHGLVRGYLVTCDSPVHRKSPLYVTDLTCASPNLAVRVGTNRHVRGDGLGSRSLRTWHAPNGTLVYVGKASLSVEELQWIPLEHSLGRSAYDDTIDPDEGRRVAAGIAGYLRALADEHDLAALEPGATYIDGAVRVGAVAPTPERGVLLDDGAVAVVAAEITRLITGLVVRQGQGHLAIRDVLVDHNDGTLFRAAEAPSCAVHERAQPFARYYVAANDGGAGTPRPARAGRRGRTGTAADDPAPRTRPAGRSKRRTPARAEEVGDDA